MATSKFYPTAICTIFLCFFFSFTNKVKAQGRFRNQLELNVDNDVFIWYTNSDRYYTFGLGLSFTRLLPTEKESRHFLKKIFPNSHGYISNYKLKLQAYTPGNLKESDDASSFDRPFAGWLYGQYTVSTRINDYNLQVGFNAGVLGSASGAGRFQNWFHGLINNDPVEGWENQIENQPGVHLLVNLRRAFIKKSWMNISMETDLSLGNIFLNAYPKARLNIGKMNSVDASSLYNNWLKDSDSPEFFVSLSGGVKLIGYNATIQGGIFEEQVFPPRELNRTVGIISLGAYMNIYRFAGSFELVHSRGEVTQAYDHKYGKVNFSFLF